MKATILIGFILIINFQIFSQVSEKNLHLPDYQVEISNLKKMNGETWVNDSIYYYTGYRYGLEIDKKV